MFSAIEWTIAGRYLRARRQEGFISVIAIFSFLGIMLGVATLIIVMSVMNGFRQELLGRILGLNGHVMVQALGQSLTDYDPMAERIRAIPGVVRVGPIVQGQVMAAANEVAAGALVRGIRAADLNKIAVVVDGIKSGRLADFGTRNKVVIGSRLASKLGLRIGDRLNIISPKGTATVIGFVPRVASYALAATFEIGMYEYDSSYIFMPLAEAQKYFRLAEGVTGLEVMLDHPDKALELRPELLAAVAGRGRLFDWQQANAQFFTALQVERNVMFVILTLIILVAAFNIISSLIMLVKDKGRDIAILRTMGATRGMVMRVFFLAGASIGIVGTLVGFAVGLAFCAYIEEIRLLLESLTGTVLWSPELRFLSRIPAVVDRDEVAMVVLMALGLSFLATLYPAWRAARLDPVEALRYE